MKVINNHLRDGEIWKKRLLHRWDRCRRTLFIPFIWLYQVIQLFIISRLVDSVKASEIHELSPWIERLEAIQPKKNFKKCLSRSTSAINWTRKKIVLPPQCKIHREGTVELMDGSNSAEQHKHQKISEHWKENLFISSQKQVKYYDAYLIHFLVWKMCDSFCNWQLLTAVVQPRSTLQMDIL